ncbi:uncharacterized protein LOC116166390 [Photinus pyralis]|uniref:uncharacterized protein LOC116166390 n=1 Tax=Photinus pyralis TaxID=7054 RepID=UPI0012673757|nr:uncharacterized protein LOC116166390 [Photinus pyralis]
MKLNLVSFYLTTCILINTFTTTGSDMTGGELNFTCSSVDDCRNFGYICKENLCQCQERYVANEIKKTCVGGIGEKCLYDEHCIDAAYCMNQSICKCKTTRPFVTNNGLLCSAAGNIQASIIKNQLVHVRGPPSSALAWLLSAPAG